MERRGRDKLIFSKLLLLYETKCHWNQKYQNETKIKQFPVGFSQGLNTVLKAHLLTEETKAEKLKGTSKQGNI